MDVEHFRDALVTQNALFKSKNSFAFYLEDHVRIAGIQCPPGWRHSKNSNKCVFNE